MTITDIFSKRQKRLRGDIPEIFVYDEISEKLRIQIIHIIKDSFGVIESYSSNTYQYRPDVLFEMINNILIREYGVFSLGNGSHENCVLNHLLKTSNIEEVIDVIELAFKFIDKIIRENFLWYSKYVNVKLKPSEAISELNDRFKEHGIGYQFESGQIIRLDSTFIHSEITKPTLSLLINPKFKGANEEYLKAHEHYRYGRNKECLTECLKAFESTLKIICTEKNWSFNQTDTSKKLIQICFQKELIPTFTQNQFTSLISLIESGIPTIRNKLGGHGQGQTPQKVDDEITRYGLNLTGTNIVFLIEQSGIV